MATTNQMHTPPAIPPETETTAATDPVIPTPRESHERPASLTSHSTNDVDAEKGHQAPTADNMPQAHQVQSNAESVYPPGRQVAVVMIALLLAMFLTALDRTILTTAIPQMTDEFHSLDDIGWYGR